jgi:hypothetical protein
MKQPKRKLGAYVCFRDRNSGRSTGSMVLRYLPAHVAIDMLRRADLEYGTRALHVQRADLEYETRALHVKTHKPAPKRPKQKPSNMGE